MDSQEKEKKEGREMKTKVGFLIYNVTLEEIKVMKQALEEHRKCQSMKSKS